MDEFAEVAAREREATCEASVVLAPPRDVRPDPGDGVHHLERRGGAVPLVRLPLLGWGILLAVHGVYAFVMKTPEEIMIERERREVSTSTGRA
jgi:hypothetical protein